MTNYWFSWNNLLIMPIQKATRAPHKRCFLLVVGIIG